MSWLRLDDGFGDHPKILLLTRSERWTFVELLTYCAKHRTDGYFPTTIADSRRHVTPSFLEKCVDAGLVDQAENGELRVHDWADFNPGKDPTGAVRQSRWRNAKRNAPRNGSITENVTGDITPSRARDPVPSRPKEPSIPSAIARYEAAGRNDEDGYGPQPLEPEAALAAAARANPDRDIDFT